MAPSDETVARVGESEGLLVRRARVRAFYSGHSLTDGVPEAVAQIAAALGDEFRFDVQSLPGSLLRERTKGDVRTAPARAWSGYQRGHSLPAGQDVATALSDRTGGGYDALVVTERHDLPYAAHAEQTALYLRDIHDRLIAGNPAGRTLLYHAWLELDVNAPGDWAAYEKAASGLWECVAHKVNLSLAAAGRADRVGMIPGGTAVVELVERVASGELPGVPGAGVGDRMRALFRDRVHPTPLGVYFMGAVHYAALFGRSPEGAVAPAGVPPELAAALQRLAWAHVRTFYAVRAASTARPLEQCRALARGLCRRFYELHGAGAPLSLLGRIKRERDVYVAQRVYADASDPRNPFAAPTETR